MPWSIVNKDRVFIFWLPNVSSEEDPYLPLDSKHLIDFFYSERLINRLPLIDNIVFRGEEKLYLKVSSKLFISWEYIDIGFGSQVHFIDKS